MKLPTLVIISIFALAFALFSNSAPAEKSAAEKAAELAAYNGQLKKATDFIGAVNTALNSPKVFTIDNVVKIAATGSFGPEFALVAGVVQLALTLYRGPQQPDNTLRNGFIEVNSRLARIEEKVDQIGVVVGTEVSLGKLKDYATKVEKLRKDYDLYIKATTKDNARLEKLKNECTSSDPAGKLLNLIQISTSGSKPTQHDVLEAIYQKSAYRRDELMSWYISVIGDYIVASFMQQVCDNLQNFKNESLKTDAEKAGKQFDLVLKKMKEYDSKLLADFAAPNGPLQKDIEKQVQDAKSQKLSYNGDMAQRVVEFLQKKYNFAFFTVQIGSENPGFGGIKGKLGFTSKHAIYNKVILNTVQAKVFESDQNIVIVNWALKSAYTIPEGEVFLRQNMIDKTRSIVEDMQKAAQNIEFCSKILNDISKKYKFLSFMFVSPGLQGSETEPYFAGDSVATCTKAVINCKKDEKKLTSKEDYEVCFGIF